MGRLDGKAALITASGSGMGREGARLFAQEGAKVVVVDINPAGGEETVKLIRESGKDAIFLRADVTKILDIEGMIQTLMDTCGKLNIVWNHAGGPCPFGLEGVIETSLLSNN